MGSGDQNADAGSTAAWLGVLACIAVISFAVLGDVIAHRDVRASAWAGLESSESAGEVVTPRARAALGAVSADPLGVLARGVARSANTAARSLAAGRVTAGAVALDAAMRAADVGRGGAALPARTAFESALHLIQRARATRQDGNAAAAASLAHDVDRLFAAVPASTAMQPREIGRYAGARLLNAKGALIGVVDHVSTPSAGGPRSATLVLGGYHHVLGFLDFGGTRIDVPASVLVFGAARALGPTRVVLATMAETPRDIQRALSSISR